MAAADKFTYPAIVKNGATEYTFDKVTTNKITIELTRVSGKGMGVTEVEIFGKEASAVENVAAKSAVSATYSYSTNLPSCLFLALYHNYGTPYIVIMLHPSSYLRYKVY